jgi:hypothetical protein
MTKEQIQKKKEYQKEYYLRPGVKEKHRISRDKRKNRPDVKEYERQWQKEYLQRPEIKEKNKIAGRERKLIRKYGLSTAAFQDMLNGQGGACASCGLDDWGFHGPVVDHDHTTGDIRGILCSGCNRAAGLLHDNPERVIKLAEYLKRHAKTSSGVAAGFVVGSLLKK